MENKIFTHNHFFPLVGDILNTAYEYMYWEHENKKEYDDFDLTKCVNKIITNKLMNYDEASFLKEIHKCEDRRGTYDYTSIDDIPGKTIVHICYELLNTPTFINKI